MAEQHNELFQEFPATSTEAWEAAIVKSLKGKDYEETLIWKTIEGIDVRPYYRENDLSSQTSFPGQSPFRRGVRIQDNDWTIRSEVRGTDEKQLNKKALNALQRGAQSIGLPATKELDTLLENIFLQYIEVNFEAGSTVLEQHAAFVQLVRERELESAELRGAYHFDPIGKLASTGNWYADESSDFETVGQLVEALEDFSSLFRGISVNGSIYHNAGGTIVEELACTLAHANEYLAQLSEQGLSADAISGHLQLEFSVGSHYFLEIAKLRAARMMWDKIMEQYQPAHSCSRATYIHGKTSSWNKSVCDPHVNMLRVTTECMAAALGGCNSITVQPYNAGWNEDDAFADRIAQNVQLLLKSESYLDKVVDAASGSYYIETLTDQLATKAWALFQEIEAKGGFLKSVQDGWLQDRLAATAERKKEQFEAGALTMLGVNKYPKADEKIEAVPVVCQPEQGVVKPFAQFRLAEVKENERLQTENTSA